MIWGVGVSTYLGRPLNESDDVWPAVCSNIRKILRRERADPFVSDIFYRAVVQAVLLFGS